MLAVRVCAAGPQHTPRAARPGTASQLSLLMTKPLPALLSNYILNLFQDVLINSFHNLLFLLLGCDSSLLGNIITLSFKVLISLLPHFSEYEFF